MASLNFTPAQNKQLVKEVREHRELYDPNSALYKQIGVRYQVWTDIAAKLDKSAEECRLRWRNIRDTYNRFKRRSLVDTSQSYKFHKRSKWKFFKHLSFLDDIAGETVEQAVEEKNEEWSSDGDSSPSQTVDDEQNDDIDVKVNIVNPLAGASPKKEITEQERGNLIVVDASFDPDERVTDNEDDHTFSMHIKSVLKKIAPRLKIKAKNEIFATLSKYEAMNLDLLEQGAASSSYKVYIKK